MYIFDLLQSFIEANQKYYYYESLIAISPIEGSLAGSSCLNWMDTRRWSRQSLTSVKMRSVSMCHQVTYQLLTE